jgi:transposase InsO family protein
MDHKLQLIADAKLGVFSVTDLADRYGVSRKTVYKWTARYDELGPEGLRDQPRTPHSCPHQTPPEVVAALLDFHDRFGWGAKKLCKLVAVRRPDLVLPCVATVSAILDRNGRVTHKPKRRKIGHPGKPSAPILAPNDIWSADFKGHFRTRDGRYCYPLTVTDNFSRYLLGCQALASTEVAGAKPVFVNLFREFGLPSRIRTDNGVPFATVTLARLSSLSAWWVRLGILPDLIEPAKPYQNGRHERMHRTLKAATCRPPAGNLRAQQRRFNHFRDEFNTVRPHEALDLDVPATLFTASPRPYPETLPPLEYPAHFETRYVSYNGGIRWNSTWINVSIVCAGEYVGLEEIDDAIWDVYFGPLKLGRLLERYMRIEDAFGHLYRHKKL